MLDTIKAAASRDGHMTQPRMRRAHSVQPAMKTTALPVAATHCPKASTKFMISGCNRGFCILNRFPHITCRHAMQLTSDTIDRERLSQP